MNTIAARLAQIDPKHDVGVTARVTPLQDDIVGSVRTPLLILLGAVGFVMLIACVNIASLSLGRMAARETELAVRVALGAGRGRIARQILTESVVLSLGGGACRTRARRARHSCARGARAGRICRFCTQSGSTA